MTTCALNRRIGSICQFILINPLLKANVSWNFMHCGPQFRSPWCKQRRSGKQMSSVKQRGTWSLAYCAPVLLGRSSDIRVQTSPIMESWRHIACSVILLACIPPKSYANRSCGFGTKQYACRGEIRYRTPLSGHVRAEPTVLLDRKGKKSSIVGGFVYNL